MARDYSKLRVFDLADRLVLDIYQETAGMPPSERFGLQAQLRRAALSAATNIVEGSARETLKDYVHFLVISMGSATEVRYLVDVSLRLGFLKAAPAKSLTEASRALVLGLQRMITTLSRGRNSQRAGKFIPERPDKQGSEA
jgi:four helix bundle protein